MSRNTPRNTTATVSTLSGTKNCWIFEGRNPSHRSVHIGTFKDEATNKRIITFPIKPWAYVMLRLRHMWIHDDTCLVKGQRLIKSFSDHFYWQWISKEALLGTARKHHGIHHSGMPTSPWWGPRSCFLIPANLMRNGPSNPPNVTNSCIRMMESVFICPYSMAILRYQYIFPCMTRQTSTSLQGW